MDELVAAGATAAASPAEVARAATVVITMLPDTPDVERVLTGPDGVLSAIQKGAIVIDMSSISPVATERLAKAVAEKGASMLDAPVSGGEIGAINAALSIMVGGEEAAFARAKPILEKMGNAEKIIHIGKSGAGQVCKVCNQVAIGGALAGVSEAIRAREESRRRRREGAAGAARRLRGEPRARSPRRADAHRQLQTGLPHEAVSEGSAAGERGRGRERRRDSRNRRSSRSTLKRSSRLAAAISITRRLRR